MTTITNKLNGSTGSNQKPSSSDNNPQLVTRKGTEILLDKENIRNGSAQIVRNIPNKIPPTQRQEPSFLDRMMMGIGALGAKTVLAVSSTKVRDVHLIRSLVPDADVAFEFIKNETPRLQQLLAKKIPLLGEFIKGNGETADQVTEELILHVLGNLALEEIPQNLRENALKGIKLPDCYRLDSKAFMEKCFIRLVDVIGPHLDGVDARVEESADIKLELFMPLALDLFNLLIPPDDAFRSWIPGFVLRSIETALAEGFLAGYTPFKQWILGVEPEPKEEEPNVIQEELNYYIPMILEKVADYTINQDLAFFQKLTSQNDIQEIVEKLTGPLLEQIELPENTLKSFGLDAGSPLVEKAARAAILRGLSNAFSTIFKDKIEKDRRVSTDDALRKTVTYLTKKLRKSFKEADYHENTLEQFYPASASLVGLFLPKFEWLNTLIERNQEKLLQPIAEVHFSFYNATVKDDSEEVYKARLREVLWDYDAVVLSGNFGASRVPLNRPTKDQSVLAGIEPAVEQLYLLCDSSLSLVRAKGADYLGDTAKSLKVFQGLQKNLAPENQLSGEVLTQVSSALNKIFKGGDPEINLFGDRCQHVLKSMIFKGLVRWLEKVPAALRSPPEELLFKAVALPLAIGVEGFTGLNDTILLNKPMIRQRVQDRFGSIDSDDYIEDSSARDLAIQNEIESEEAEFATTAVAPTVNEWIDLFFDGGQDIPLPDSMKVSAEKRIRKEASSLVAKIFTATTSWIVDRKSSEDKLNDLFPSKNPLRMCHLIPHLAVEGISYGIRENQDKIVADGMMPMISSMLPQDQSLDLLNTIISGFVNKLGANDSDDFKQLLNFIGVFSETAAIRFIGNVFGRIHQMEVDGVNLTSVLEDLLKGNLEIVKEHLKGINVAKEDADKSSLSRDELIQSFVSQDILHPALQDEDSKKEFFNSLTLILFEIFKINKESEFPVPDYAKEFVYEIFSEITPGILNSACDHVRDASTINGILVSALNQAANEESISILDRLFTHEHKDFREHLKDLDSKFSDQFQIDLQKELGETVEALVGLQTDRLPKYLVKNEKLKSYAAEAIGQPLRAELRNKKTGTPISLLTMLDGVFAKVGDGLAPSIWVDESLVYLETSFKGEVQIDDQTGDPKISDAPNLARFFPRTKKEKALKAKYDKYQAKKTKKNVPRYLRKLINDQTSQIAIEAFILLWANLEKNLSQWLVANIGEEYGEKIYNVLLPVTRWVIKYPLSVALIIFNYSIWLIASQLLKWVLAKEAEEIVKDVNINIHDNAIYKGLELILTRYAEELTSIADSYADNDDDASVQSVPSGGAVIDPNNDLSGIIV